MILPWTVLALLYIAIYARLTRNNLLETLGEDYIRTARAKGLSERRVILKHGLRASLTPIVTIFGLDMALLVGGAIITESVFNIQGLGWLAFNGAHHAGPAERARRGHLHRDGGRAREPDRRHPLRVPRSARQVRIGVDGSVQHVDTPRRPRTSPCASGRGTASSRRSRTSRSRCRRGETLGVVGESGSGKSVTSLAIMGLHNPATAEITGEILFEGKDLLKLSPAELRGRCAGATSR